MFERVSPAHLTGYGWLQDWPVSSHAVNYNEPYSLHKFAFFILQLSDQSRLGVVVSTTIATAMIT
jgi:hypothetical protein